MYDILLDGHRKLRALIAEAEALIAGPTCPDLGKLGRLRWAMTREVIEHLYLEERYAYDGLSHSPLPSTRAVGQDFKQSMKPLLDEYLAHMQRWQGSIGPGEWAEYVASSRALLDRLTSRIADEECRLYPLLEADRIRRAG